jgi:hypothetical protein
VKAGQATIPTPPAPAAMQRILAELLAASRHRAAAVASLRRRIRRLSRPRRSAATNRASLPAGREPAR